MLIRKNSFWKNTWSAIRVSILLILDVDSEVPGSQKEAYVYSRFQSFLFWMLIRKAIPTIWGAANEFRFNPSYSGCWFGRLYWFRKAWTCCRVSILLILDVDSEALAAFEDVITLECFNPSYSGCWFGRPVLVDTIWIVGMFQSFLFWMLIRKAFRPDFTRCILLCFNPSYSGCWFGRKWLAGESTGNNVFQSFLFWMLIRKGSGAFSVPSRIISFNPSYSGCWFGSFMTMDQVIYIVEVSILLILDVDSEAPKSKPQSDIIAGFNPSYSGCWFGSCVEIFNPSKQVNVSILLILDVDSEAQWTGAPVVLVRVFQSFLFWMLIRKLLFRNILNGQKSGFQSFLFWMLIRKLFDQCGHGFIYQVSILLILDVDSEVLTIF